MPQRLQAGDHRYFIEAKQRQQSGAHFQSLEQYSCQRRATAAGEIAELDVALAAERTLGLDELWVGPGSTSASPEELLIAVSVPLPAAM